ncbi:MAG: alpha/beta fold hydrolase [Verrucomicrobia bacterium]|nr:alpha/beta fold hydrolase [Verrucomicrobiota bacterium]
MAPVAWEKFSDGSQGRVEEYRGVNETPITAYVRKPKGDGPFPAVVLIHGGGESATGTHALGRMTTAPTENFIARGWAVYSIDFRPQSPFLPIEWDDACRAIATLRAMPFVDAKRIALMGGSHGGYNTARVASRCDLSCAIPCAAAAIDPVEVAKAQQAGEAVNQRAMDAIRKQAAGYGLMLEELTTKLPANYNTPLTEVANVRCPLLLISGRNDSSSPPSVMETYAQKLRAAGKQVELYLPDNGPHGFYFGNPRIAETDEAARRAVEFIAKHFALPLKSSNVATTPGKTAAITPAATKRESANDAGKAEQLFRRLDKNNDGKIAGDEAASEPGKKFVRMFDKNGDGIVTLAEIGGGSPASPSPQSDAGKAKSAAPRAESQRGDSALLQSKSFQSAALKGEVSYTLYLPPGYENDKQRRFPVVFWLHGGGGTPRDCWKFVEVTDAAIKVGHCPEMLIVGVDGRSRGGARTGSQYSDWKDGSLPMETVIIKELLPHIDQTCRTLGTREGRSLEGFSMGGHGALHLAFRHPDLFGAVTALGPALIMPGDGGNRVQEVYQNGAYKGDEAYWRAHDPLTLAEKNPVALKGKMFIRLITGEVEGNFTHRRTVELSAKLKSLGIEHEFIRPGETGHNYVKYYEAMPDAPKFYAKAFGQPAPPKKSAATDPAPPVCYDISKSFPGEIGQYRVSRTSRPVEPFEIMDGLYYVGNSQVSAHLLTTTNGLVLMDSTMPHQVPWLLDSIRKLGFDPRDVKVVIGGHAHLDHIGGHWYFQQHHGAQTWLHEADAAATESGAWQPGKPVALDGTLATISVAFPPFKTDRRLRDGETVEWGGRKFTFHLAAGHTPGTLFIEFPLRDKSSGKITIAGMLGGVRAGAAFAPTAARLRAVDVQLWLGAHPNQNKTFDKQRLLRERAQPNPFIDPVGWQEFLKRMSGRAGAP